MSIDVTANSLIACIPKIEQLSLRFSDFNPFKVLGLSDAEIRHSNTISWLLNPNENHGLGSSFFKTFIRTIISSSENESVENYSNGLRELILGDFSDLQIDREKSHIDILCISHSNKIVVIIENKVYSGEYSNQLNSYLSTVKSQYQDHICIPIFLSIEGLAPSHSEYLAASYKHIWESINHVTKLLKDRIPKQIVDFLQFYQQIISEKTMIDPTLQEIARKIYRENKPAIDFIHSIGISIDLSDPGNRIVEKDDNLVAIWPGPGWYTFADKGFVIPKKIQNDWGKGNPVQYWFSPYYEKLKICLEVGPFDSGKDRLDFLLQLEKNGIRLRPSSKTETGTYTRLYTQTIYIKDWQDFSEIEEKMKSLLDNKDLRKLVEIVKTVIKNHTTFWT